ncbi:MAG: hypothetical protein ACKOU6_19620, partial [Planctomycetota bacterium]
QSVDIAERRTGSPSHHRQSGVITVQRTSSPLTSRNDGLEVRRTIGSPSHGRGLYTWAVDLIDGTLRRRRVWGVLRRSTLRTLARRINDAPPSHSHEYLCEYLFGPRTSVRAATVPCASSPDSHLPGIRQRNRARSLRCTAYLGTGDECLAGNPRLVDHASPAI